MAKPRPTPPWVSEHIPEELVNSTIFRFRITLPGKQPIRAEVDLLADLDVDYEDLEQQMSQIPSIYAYWAAIYSELRRITATLERAIKARRGAAVAHIVEEGRNSQTKLTDKSVAMLLEKDTKLDELEHQLNKVNMNVGKLYHMLEALKMKADMLRSLAGFKRQERADS